MQKAYKSKPESSSYAAMGQRETKFCYPSEPAVRGKSGTPMALRAIFLWDTQKSSPRLPTWDNLVLRWPWEPFSFGISRFKSGRRRRIMRISGTRKPFGFPSVSRFKSGWRCFPAPKHNFCMISKWFCLRITFVSQTRGLWCSERTLPNSRRSRHIKTNYQGARKLYLYPNRLL